MNNSANSFDASNAVRFPAAIELTQQFVLQLQAGGLNSEQVQSFVADLVTTPEGARGFFVGYLTHELDIANQDNPDIIRGLATQPTLVAELLVKNLAMSTAQNLHFQRENQADMAANSALVAQRSGHLIRALQLPEITLIAEQLLTAIRTGTGDYVEFLERWGYDTEQKGVIDLAISAVV